MLSNILHDVVQIQNGGSFFIPHTFLFVANRCLICANNQAHVHHFRFFHLINAPTCCLDQNKRSRCSHRIHILVIAEVGRKFKIENVERLIFALTTECLSCKELVQFFMQLFHSVNRCVITRSHFVFLPACVRILDTSCCSRSCKIISLSGSTSSLHTVLCIALADGLDMV